MEESVGPKRAREEPQVKEDYAVDCEEESSKRHKPYNHILSLLESDESEDSTQQDLSPLITTLQQEILTFNSNSSHDTHLSPSQNINYGQDTYNLTTTKSTLEDCSTSTITSAATATHSNGSVLEEDDKVGVMRHLLEASDDELGIPNRGELERSLLMEGFGEDNGLISGGDMFAPSLCDGLWELEDETANYYALLHSELFL